MEESLAAAYGAYLHRNEKDMEAGFRFRVLRLFLIYCLGRLRGQGGLKGYVIGVFRV